ncbi:MAG: CRTAC1 family protein [Thermoanaerobaculia bacterium]|nr:CRTAC1 family protein [Thermoanaerobaculia bacterium]
MKHAFSPLCWCLCLTLYGCDGVSQTVAVQSEAAPSEFMPWVFERTQVDPTPDASETLGSDYSMEEIMGSGMALLDIDDDSDLDLLVAESGWLYEQDAAGHFGRRARLYELTSPLRATGCSVGDVDNDGDVDLFVATTGKDMLFLNSGNGELTLAPGGGGLGAAVGWSTSAAFLDYDNDGWLDLYVVRYVESDASRVCRGLSGHREYCGPEAFRGLPDLLYRNLGGGKFAEVGDAAGISRRVGKGLGVVAVDVNGDGWTDLYVANDGERNHLWINQRDGNFEESAIPWGAAVNLQGREEASMGIAVGDVDADGSLDLFVSHLDRESNTLYRGIEGRAFQDVTFEARLGEDGLPFTGFGTALGDLDLDGDLDLLVADGKVRLEPQQATIAESEAGLEGGAVSAAAYAEVDQLYLNDGKGRFRWVEESAPGREPKISRAALMADWDRDGDLDLAIAHVGAPPVLWRNETPRAARHWMRLQVWDPALSREAVGALITVSWAGGERVLALTRSGSYLASGDGLLHIGLGAVDRIEDVVVRWVGGEVESFGAMEVDRTVTVKRGEGRSQGDLLGRRP